MVKTFKGFTSLQYFHHNGQILLRFNHTWQFPWRDKLHSVKFNSFFFFLFGGDLFRNLPSFSVYTPLIVRSVKCYQMKTLKCCSLARFFFFKKKPIYLSRLSVVVMLKFFMHNFTYINITDATVCRIRFFVLIYCNISIRIWFLW